MPSRRTLNVPLQSSAGYAIAEPLVAAEPNPRFDNSAVDGYAVGCREDTTPGTRLRLQGAVPAGQSGIGPIRTGSAVRILTGAPVPVGTFGIAMQEDVEVHGDEVMLREEIREGRHIRRAGADFAAGSVLAHAGAPIDAALAAHLAFSGVVEPLVFARPSVAVLTSGDELVDPGTQPEGAQIRDTNSAMLGMQVLGAIGKPAEHRRVLDDRRAMLDVLRDLAERNDVVLAAGGASVGDRDYLADVVRELGSIRFHGVKIRPGKPLLFGRIGGSFVIGLPGNPASDFVCFEVFVRETLRRLSGWVEPCLCWSDTVIGFDHPACGREDFVRVRQEGARLVSAGDQGSYGLCSLGQAHGLARLPADRHVHAGEVCPVVWLR